MALTPQEADELRQLEAEDHAQAGEAAIDQVDAQRLKPAPATRPFSLKRVTLGSIRDAAQQWLDFAEDTGKASSTIHQAAKVQFGDRVGGAITSAFENIIPGGKIASGLQGFHAPELPDLKGSENAGTAETVTRAIGSYLVPFAAWGKVFGITKGATWLGRAGRAMLAGAATDFTSLKPHQANLANTVKDLFGIDNPTLDALTSEEDDTTLAARFKAAAVNMPVSLTTDAFVEGGLRTVRAYKAWRGSLEEADALMQSLKEADKVDTPAILNPKQPEAPKPSANDNGVRASMAVTPEAKAAPEAIVPGSEDILDFLMRKTSEGASDEEINQIGERLTANPTNALQDIGINPLKVDFAAYDDPEMLGKLQKGLVDIYESIAQRLGRTGVRVTEQATARAARALATTGDVLKDLYGHTSNLAEIMYASQTFVGAHAARLLADGKAALSAIEAGGGEAEWLKFLESFQRHAYFLGALRGAGSEVGRALRSLQMIQKVGRKAATRNLGEAVAAEAKKAPLDPKITAQLAQDSVSQMRTPAERITFLSQLAEKDGDLGDLSRFVRTKAGSVSKRLDTALGETRGNLFASSTAVMNTFASVAMLGIRGLAKGLSAVAAMSMSPFGKAYSMEARVRMLDTWAYVDGIMGGWRLATQNTLALLEREGMAEVSLNLNTFGAKQLAARAASMSAEGTRKIGRNNFERIDINARERAFAMSPADIQRLDETINSMPGPDVFNHALRWLVRTVAPVINAAGTMSRLGTILFVNSPDQFMGTLASRAGAQAHAVRLAAQEAAELGIEGKDLSTYIKARMVQLTETVDGFSEDPITAGQQEVALAHGDAEARTILFQDKPETAFGAAVSRGLGQAPFFHLIVPFVRTPMRILERTVIDFTPLGLLKDRVRADIMAGGARRDEAIARIGLGTMMVYTAFQLAEDRTIVGSDGTYKSTARLSRPSYSLKVGDDYYEFSRVDPLGTLLGWGADLHAYLRDQENNPNASEAAKRYLEGALVATQANILSKTWLTSLRNLVELADASSGDEFTTRLNIYLKSFGARLVPGSGMQRSIQKGIDANVYDAGSFMEGLLQASFGADTLPIKRDHILGRPVTMEAESRAFGMSGGIASEDPLLTELERLSFDLPSARRTVRDVPLTSQQFNRFLELRGQIVRHPNTNLTLDQTLNTLIRLPEYQALPRGAKVAAMRKEMNGFSQIATQQMMREDHDFARRALKAELWKKAEIDGSSPQKRDAELQQLGHELGLDQ